MPSNKVRTRFAPSPTGYMHVGNLRTALYTYLMAKHEGGTFILRIEDTDQGRYVEGAVDVIYNTLRETGLLWDEGPDVGGPVGPYVQSERMGMFKQYAEQLVKITREHGEWFEKNGFQMMAVYHPAALLRDPRRRPESFEDFKGLQQKINELCEHTHAVS